MTDGGGPRYRAARDGAFDRRLRRRVSDIFGCVVRSAFARQAARSTNWALRQRSTGIAEQEENHGQH